MEVKAASLRPWGPPQQDFGDPFEDHYVGVGDPLDQDEEDMEVRDL